MSAVPKWEPGHLYLPGDLVQPVQSTASSASALTNPSFETGDLSGWTITQTGGVGTASVATDKKFAGTYAGRWHGAAGSGHAGGVEAVWENATNASVTPGQSITASMLFALDDTDSSQNQAQVRLHWYNGSGARIATSLGTLIHGNTSAWLSSGVTGTAPAGAATVRLAAWTTANASGGVRLDTATWNHRVPITALGLIYKAVQAGPGTSANAEPAWPTTLGVSVTDGTVTWESVLTSRVIWEASPVLQSDGAEPDWPTTPGAFVSDGSLKWECVSRHIADEKCPHSKVVAIASAKVFAADRDIVRFCATANPLDWSSAQDAGFLPTGLQQANANDMAVLGIYRSNLVALNASSFQNWQVDPDPAAMALLDQMEGIGSSWPRAQQPVSNELLFLSQLGVRSVSIAAGGDNLSAGDIGTPVDELIQAAMAAAGATARPLATYYPSAGQYWLAITQQPQPTAISISGNLADAYVGDTGSYRYAISGGRRPYTVSLLSGSLPPGATLASDGTISYTYTTPGTYSWVLQAVDADGLSDQVSDGAVISALPVVSYAATGVPYKFMYAADANINTDYSSPSFDDSAWSTGQGGFGFGSAPAGAQTIHTFTDRGHGARIWIRQHVAMAAGRDCVVTIWRDDGAKFWWNGVHYPVVTTSDYYRVTVTIPGSAVTGNDFAALRVTDGNPDEDSTASVGSDGIYASMGFVSL